MANINPKNILAILIGVAKYNDTGLPPLPAARKNAQELEKIFLNTDLIGIPDDQVISITEDLALIDQNKIREFIGDRITEIINQLEKPIDAIVFYYAGHGLLDSQRNYYLCVKDTKKDRKNTSALDLNVLRDDLLSYNKKLVMILDSCFSENAIDEIKANVSDYYIMASSAYNKTSDFPVESEYAAFTAELIDILNNGIRSLAENEYLTFANIFEEIKNRLIRKNFAEPKCTDKNQCGNLGFAKNKTYTATNEQYSWNKARTVNYLKEFAAFDDGEDNIDIILDHYPIFVSCYLKDILPNKATKLANENFFRIFYTQVIKFLVFVALKNCEQNLSSTEKEVINNIFKNKPTIELYYRILSVACNKGGLLIKEFNSEASFLKIIRTIQDDSSDFKKFRSDIEDLINSLAFLCTYNIYAVRFIKVSKGYYSKAKYLHEISDLYGQIPKKYKFSDKLPLMHNAAVILYSKSETLSDSNYLDLWPFIIDKNGSDSAGENPEIKFYSFKQDGIYYYGDATPKNENLERQFTDAYKSLLTFPTSEECGEYFKKIASI